MGRGRYRRANSGVGNRQVANRKRGNFPYSLFGYSLFLIRYLKNLRGEKEKE